ncbi:MAG: alanine--tRNA ligase [Actinobacteria bacterium]|nr:MAG: alanine--tRNA ligase [Actinomycetota bacterium]
MRTSAELREGFLSYFESKGHKRHPSGSLVPPDWDRSTLLNSAGMQPLMPYFLGREQPPAPLLTTVQKVFRTPDIDEVGLDTFHLTFFEMLGNFSFGEYFKEGAIDFAWEFVFDRMQVDPDKFWVTVFAGDPELGLGEDEEAIRFWEAKGMPPERIVRLDRSHNFWSVGGPGPCGPDTELFYDRGEEIGCGRTECAPGCECERFLEFWNLVFMEYELHEDGTVTPLPKQNVDTGMGLERAATILQDVIATYDTDGYQEIMSWIAGESGVAYGDSEAATKAHRILADHGRGMTFLVGDGVTPSNEGRGYVLRRIIRRAVQQARTIGLTDLWRISDIVVEQIGLWYPELGENRELIRETLKAEEERFSQTLERGLKLFEDVAARGSISGEDAFTLAATYGFPFELTRELAAERGLQVDEDEFSRLMAEHREVSRSTDVRVVADLGGPPTDFVGYEKLDVLTAVSAHQQLDGRTFQAKLFESPFYPEGGGQVTDQGYIEHEGTSARAILRAADRLGDDQILTFEGEGFAEGDRVRAVVDWKARFPTMANHTATHLLHKALQDVLGDHVRQAGSAVRPDKLRFDFTHGHALSQEERKEVERRVNEKVFENLPVHAFVTPIDEAKKLGAMMLFGEKYGAEVRLVEIPGFSRELCGGTHVRWTAEIGPFVITSESSVGSGARRIEALTAGEAYAFLHGKELEAEELRRETERLRKQGAKQEKAAAAADVKVLDESNGIVTAEVKSVKGSELRDLSDQLRQSRRADAVLLGSVDDGRAYLVVNIDASKVEQGADAVAIVKEAAKKIGGGGGGRPNLAEAGGKNPDGLAEAYEIGRSELTSTLGS